MSRSKLTKSGIALGAALLATAAGASSASAGVTTFKQVGGKLTITAANNDVNNISLQFYSHFTGGGGSSLRIKDLGAGVTLSPGVGIGSTATYAPGDISFNTDAEITSVRVKSGNLNDTINTSLTPFPTQSFGAGGDDTITVGAANSVLSGGAGNDILNGGSKDDTLIGGTGDDFLYGFGGDDVFYTVDSLGSDDIDGGVGDDHATVDGADFITAIESLQIND